MSSNHREMKQNEDAKFYKINETEIRYRPSDDKLTQIYGPMAKFISIYNKNGQNQHNIKILIISVNGRMIYSSRGMKQLLARTLELNDAKYAFSKLTRCISMGFNDIMKGMRFLFATDGKRTGNMTKLCDILNRFIRSERLPPLIGADGRCHFVSVAKTEYNHHYQLVGMQRGVVNPDIKALENCYFVTDFIAKSMRISRNEFEWRRYFNDSQGQFTDKVLIWTIKKSTEIEQMKEFEAVVDGWPMNGTWKIINRSMDRNEMDPVKINNPKIEDPFTKSLKEYEEKERHKEPNSEPMDEEIAQESDDDDLNNDDDDEVMDNELSPLSRNKKQSTAANLLQSFKNRASPHKGRSNNQ